MHYMDIVLWSEEAISINIVLSKLSNRSTRKCCELCSELTTKIFERRRLRVLLLLTLHTNKCLLGRYRKFTQWLLVYF